MEKLRVERLGAEAAEGGEGDEGGDREPREEKAEAWKQGREGGSERRRVEDERRNFAPRKGGGGSLAVAEGAVERALHFAAVVFGLGEEGEVLRGVVAGEGLGDELERGGGREQRAELEDAVLGDEGGPEVLVEAVEETVGALFAELEGDAGPVDREVLGFGHAVLFEDGDALGLEGFAAVGIAEGGFEFGAEGDAGRRGVERAA